MPELADAIVASPARRLVTLNLAADNETLGLSVADHLAALHWYLPQLRVDTVLADVGGSVSRRRCIGPPGRSGLGWCWHPWPLRTAVRSMILSRWAAALVPVLGSDR